MDLLVADREARGAVGHHALALGRADGGAKVGLARQTRRALAAFGRIKWNDVIAFFHRSHARSHIDDDAGALMAEDRGKESLRVGA